jgi:hypothetical protein
MGRWPRPCATTVPGALRTSEICALTLFVHFVVDAFFEWRDVDMTPDKFSGDALFIKLGWMEIAAVGTLGITAFLVLVGVYIAARIFMAVRRR